MTAPITYRPLKRAGRKPIKPPPGTADRIRELAADGFSVVGVAQHMGVSRVTFDRWLADYPDLKDAFDAGRESERFTLHNRLYRLAVEKDHAVAAMFLLKARHGYREGDQSDQAGRVNLTIALPGAMTLQQFNALNTNRKGNHHDASDAEKPSAHD